MLTNRVPPSGAPADEIVIVLRCLDAMLIRRRKQVSLQRAMAFIKRISALGLHVQSHASVGLLAAARAALHVSACVHDKQANMSTKVTLKKIINWGGGASSLL